MCSFSSALSRPRRIDMISASIGRTFVAWRTLLFVRKFDDQVWAMAVAASFLTLPSTTIQVLDKEDWEKENAFFRFFKCWFLSFGLELGDKWKENWEGKLSTILRPDVIGVNAWCVWMSLWSASAVGLLSLFFCLGVSWHRLNVWTFRAEV